MCCKQHPDLCPRSEGGGQDIGTFYKCLKMGRSLGILDTLDAFGPRGGRSHRHLRHTGLRSQRYLRASPTAAGPSGQQLTAGLQH